MFMNPCSKFCYNHSSFSLSLSPHLPSWKIKGRVVQKTGVQLYKNQKGRGRYFHFVLQDTSGKIQVTAYNNEVHLYFDTVKLNEVYSLSGAVLKQTNPVYPSLTNHAYALTLNVSSNLRLLTANDEQCPAIEYNFMRIDLIQRLSGKNTVDVIGVCVHCSELAIVESSRGQRARRELVLMDQSKASIKLVMYDDIAIHFAWNPLEPIVVSARNAQVSANDDFLIVSNLTTLEINPSMDKAFTLLGWYNRIGKNLPSAGQEQVALRNCITIEHIRLEKFDDQASKRFTINGLIDKINQVTVYDACEICHKKVFRQGDLTFHCEKCQKKWPSSKKRVIATVTVADHTDSCEVTFYHDMCVRMFGSQLETILGTENCSEQTYNIIRGLHFKRYLLKLNSTHTGGKTKNSVIALTPIDMKEYGQNLLNPTIE